MSLLHKLRSTARNLFRRRQVERDLDDEIHSFAEMLDDENRARGLSPAEARRQAQIDLGGSMQVKEQVRDVRAGAWIDGLLQDLRYGARMLTRNGGFTAAALLTLALGIGANTALFSVVDALLLRGLPYRDADRLVYVSEFWPHEPVVPGPPSTDFAYWRAEAHTVDGLGAYGGGAALTLTGAGEPERIQGTMATAGLLDLIGIRPMLGRNFTTDEDRLGGPPAVILGHALWERRFASSPEIVGKMIQLDGRGCTVVGVLGADFLFPDNNFGGDLLVPMALPANPSWRDEQHFRLLRVMVRRKPGVTPEAVRSEFAAILGRHRAEEAPQFAVMRKDMEVRATPLRDWLSGRIRTLALVLQGTVAMVLLIGCLNVANLQIARAIARQKEMAVRAALGAGKRRLIRQALTESLLLALLGGAGGLVLAYGGLRYVRGFLPANLHLASTVRIDPAALAFTIAAAALAGIVTGLAPMLAIARAPMDEALRQAGRSTESGASQRLHGALVVAEVALAMVLLAGAGLLVRNLARMTALEPGFQPRGVLTVRMSLPQRKYQTGESRAAFYSQLLERAASIPGVERASVSAGIPVTGTPMLAGAWFEGRPAPPRGGRPSIPLNSISEDYFRTLKIPLLRGRAFSRADRGGTAAIVNQAFAEHFFPGQDALGKHIQYGAGRDWHEIVGIVGNVREGGFRKASLPTMYEPSLEFWEMTLALRSSRPPAALAREISTAVRAIDPNQPVFDIATMEDRIGEALAGDRANTILMGVFAGLALVLAAVGVFGVLAYFVSRRAHEIGIRMALGAKPGGVLCMVLGRGMALAGAGIGVGLVGALFTSRAMETLLFEMKPGDPLTLATAPALFACVAALACYLPARRAAKVDPMVTLRHE